MWFMDTLFTLVFVNRPLPLGSIAEFTPTSIWALSFGPIGLIFLDTIQLFFIWGLMQLLPNRLSWLVGWLTILGEFFAVILWIQTIKQLGG